MKRTAFTLIELLVVTATILLLMSLTAVAVSSARSSQRRNQTRVTISKINEVLTSQWRTYPSQSVRAPSGWTNNQYKRWSRITGDMPPNWLDVAEIAGNATAFKTKAQKTYRQFWNQKTQTPTDQYADGECLFLTVMYGGFAGCLDCAGLRSKRGGMGKGSSMRGVIHWVLCYGRRSALLWNLFFSNGDNSSDTLTYELRPLVFSAGPNGAYGIDVGASSNLNKLQNCGLPSANTSLGSVLNSSDAADNLTNFDAEFRR